MRPEICLRVLRDDTRSLLLWAISTVALLVLLMAFYPPIINDSTLADSLNQLPDSAKAFSGVNDFTSPAGYLNSQWFATLGLILFLVFAIGRGARSIAGEEEATTMDLLLATPVSRQRVVLDKTLALVIQIFILSLVGWVTIIAVGPSFQLEFDAGLLAAASISLFGVATLYGAVATAIGCLTASRGLALGIASALAVLAYLLTSLAPMVDLLDSIKEISPLYHAYGYQPLIGGLDWGSLAFLIIGTLLFTALAVFGFARRDVRFG